MRRRAPGIALYLFLPERLLVAPRYVLPALECLPLVPLVVINPRRLTRQTDTYRVLSLTLAAVIAVSNRTALVTLVHELVYVGTSHLVIARAVSILHRPATGFSGAGRCGAPDRQPRPSPYRRT